MMEMSTRGRCHAHISLGSHVMDDLTRSSETWPVLGNTKPRMLLVRTGYTASVYNGLLGRLEEKCPTCIGNMFHILNKFPMLAWGICHRLPTPQVHRIGNTCSSQDMFCSPIIRQSAFIGRSLQLLTIHLPM